MSIDQLKSQLSRFNIKPSKKLGQNFLLNEEVLDEMVKAAELGSDDKVVEVGPGLGALTKKLAERAKLVLAVEKDRKLVRALRKLFKSKKRVKIIQGDALFLKPETNELEPNAYKVVANIPYYLTGKLLRNFLEAERKPELMVLLLQQEVAERLTAKPGDHSVLSITTQFYAEPEMVMAVAKENFYPVPEVDSTIVKLAVRPDQLFAVDEKKFFQLVKVGFASKRKQLHNNLKAVFDGNVKQVLDEAGVNPKARAEDLSLDEWMKIYEKLIL